MKKLFFTLLFVSSLFTITYADNLTTTSDNTYITGFNKIIRIQLPDNVSAINGEVFVKNASLLSITEEYINKTIALNGNKFVLYELNNEIAIGDNLIITILPTNNNQVEVSLINCKGASPQADDIEISDFVMKINSGFDINQDGLTDVSDVTYAIQEVFKNKPITITDIQKIINSIISEI